VRVAQEIELIYSSQGEFQLKYR